MRLQLTGGERQALEGAAAHERRVRQWRKYRAMLRLADGEQPETVAAALGCARSRVFAWAAAWRQRGLAGVVDRRPTGGGGLAAIPLAGVAPV